MKINTPYSALLSVFLMLAMNILCYFLANFFFLNGDVASQLSMAEYVIEGQAAHNIYSPSYTSLHIAISAPAIFLHHLLPNLNITACFSLYMIGLLDLSLLLCWKILLSLPTSVIANRTGLLLSLSYLLAVLPSLTFLPEFGQRENITCILILPYLFLALGAMLKTQHAKWIRVVAGIMGAIGFCLKPFFALLFIVSELCVLVQQRRLTSWVRVESLLIGLLGISYILLWHYIDPKFAAEGVQLGNYYMYTLLGPLLVVALMASIILTLFAGCIYLYIKLLRKDALPLLCRFGFALFWASLIILLMQTRGSAQHVYMVIFFIAFILLLLPPARRTSLYFIMSCVVITVFLFFVNGTSLSPMSWQHRKISDREQMLTAASNLRPYIEGKHVAILTTHMLTVWQIFSQTGAKFDGPDGNLAYLMSVYRKQKCCIPPENLRPEELYFQNQYINFLLAEKPEWILAQDYSYGMVGNRIDKVKHFLTDPRFHDFWKSYKPITVLYTIWGKEHITLELYQRIQ